MIELRDDALLFSFPEVHPQAGCEVNFVRTLRIPDDNRLYPLPVGFGCFPLHHVDDFLDRLPAAWGRHGGVFLPMYQAEALWVNFHTHYESHYPCAVKIAAGKVNAINGAPWQPALTAEPQDYVVLPDQQWLDGYAVGPDMIRQFVAMPLGEGYSAEEQLTAAASHGGLQLLVYPLKRERYQALLAERAREAARLVEEFGEGVRFSMASPKHEMGLSPGGLMTQKIYADPFGVDAWDQTVAARCFVHLTNSLGYHAITGQKPPHKPPTAKDYTRAGIPWFKVYAGDKKALPGAGVLAGLDSLATRFFKQHHRVLPDNEPVKTKTVVSLVNTAKVREGDF